MPILVDKYKTTFWENKENVETLEKRYISYLYIFVFPIIFFEVCRNPKLNLLKLFIMVQSFKMPNLVDEYKTIFQGTRGKRSNSP